MTSSVALVVVTAVAVLAALAGAQCVCDGVRAGGSGPQVRDTNCGAQPVNKFQQNGVCVPTCDFSFYTTIDTVDCQDKLFCRVQNCAIFGQEPSFNKPDCSICTQCDTGYELALNQPAFRPCLVEEAPNITCPANVHVNFTDQGTQTSVNFDDLVSATDNVQISTLTCSPASGSQFPVDGIARTVTCTATDVNGLSSSCTFPVTVEDVAPPVFIETCAVFDPQVGVQGEQVTVEWTRPIATDNVDGNITAVCSRDPDDPADLLFSAGLTIIRCTAEDTAGLSVSCNIAIRVVDNSAPIMTCPESIVDAVALDQRSKAIEFDSLVSAVSAGTNETIIPTCSPVSGSPFTIGTSEVTCIAKDSLTQSECTFAVELEDNQPPTLLGCPQTISVPMTPGSTTASVQWAKPTASDNSGSVTVACSRVEGDFTFTIGTTEIACTATDSSRNTAQCSITITVEDTELPKITCPQSFDRGVTAGASTVPITFTVQATDNFALIGAPICTHTSGSDFSVGQYDVECTARDLNSNFATCSFLIRVFDDSPPTLTCPSIPETPTDTGVATATVSFTVEAEDNVEVDTVTCDHDPAGSSFSVGNTLVSCRGNDTSDNVAFCNFEVVIVDTEKPKVTCPGTVNAEYEPPAIGVLVNFTAPTAEDNNAGEDLILETLLAGAGISTSVFLSFGTRQVDFVATDIFGNSEQCAFEIVVTRNGDFDPPVLTCPTLLNVTNDGGKRTAVVEWLIDVNDASAYTEAITSRPTPGQNSGSEFPIGLSTITDVVTDEWGNVAECEFDIVVNDGEAPKIDCPPSNSFNTAPGAVAAVATWPAVTAKDNYILASGQPVVSRASGSVFAIGEHTVTASATDLQGLTSYCNFTITIIGLAGNGTVAQSTSNNNAAAAGGAGLAAVLLIILAIIFLVRRHRKHVLEMEEKMSDFKMTDEAILARAQAIQIAMQNKAKGKAPKGLDELGDGPKRKFMAPPPDLDDLCNLDKYMPYDSTIGELRREDVIIESEIGSGEFGTVYSGRVLFDGGKREVRVAIKSLKEKSSDDSRVTFLQEIAVQGQFTHPNIVSLVGYVTKDEPVLMCIEFMELGSLKSYLQSDIVKGNLTLRDFIRMASDVCAGMYYLGQCNFVHRDLAARNCLINQDLVVKIADFGLSVEMDSEAMAKSKANSQERIPIRWTSPEAIKDKHWSTASDVWSFGVVLWEMFTYAEHPYKGWTNRRVVDEVLDGYRLSVPPKCPMLIYAIMMDCWNIDVEERITFKVAYQRLQAAWSECVDGVVGYEAVARAGAYSQPGLGNPDAYEMPQDAPGENYDNHEELQSSTPSRFPSKRRAPGRVPEDAADDNMYDMAGTGEQVFGGGMDDDCDQTIYDEADDGMPVGGGGGGGLMPMTSRLSVAHRNNNNADEEEFDDVGGEANYDMGDAYADGGGGDDDDGGDATYDLADQ